MSETIEIRSGTRAAGHPRGHRAAHRRRAHLGGRACRCPSRRSRPPPWSACIRCRPTAASWTRTSSARPLPGYPRSRDLAVLRFNFRGTSLAARNLRGGAFDNADRGGPRSAGGDGLRGRAVALRRRGRSGWSFGTEVALKHGTGPSRSRAIILLSPPLHRTTPDELAAWAGSGKRVVVGHPRTRRLPAARRGGAALRCAPGGRAHPGRRTASTCGWASTQTYRVLSEIVGVDEPRRAAPAEDATR